MNLQGLQWTESSEEPHHILGNGAPQKGSSRKSASRNAGQKAFSRAQERFRPDNRGSRGPEAQIRPCCDGIGESVLKALSVISIGASALVLRQLAVLAAENEREQRELGEIRTQEGKTEQDEAKGLEPVEQLGLATCQ